MLFRRNASRLSVYFFLFLLFISRRIHHRRLADIYIGPEAHLLNIDIYSFGYISISPAYLFFLTIHREIFSSYQYAIKFWFLRHESRLVRPLSPLHQRVGIPEKTERGEKNILRFSMPAIRTSFTNQDARTSEIVPLQEKVTAIFPVKSEERGNGPCTSLCDCSATGGSARCSGLLPLGATAHAHQRSSNYLGIYTTASLTYREAKVQE